MKPRRKIEKKVSDLSNELPKITKEQEQWGYDNCNLNYFSISRKKHYCLECGHEWKQKSSSKVVCPHCNTKLQETDNKSYQSIRTYYGVVTTYKGWQVVRVFVINKFLQKKKKANYSIQEVMQHWLSGKGESVVLEKRVVGMSIYYDMWISGSEFSIATNSNNALLRRSINAFKYYPKRQVLPIIKRNGFKTSFLGLPPQRLFRLILTNSMFETLVKANQKTLAKEFDHRPTEIEKYWGSIKICIRNNYVPSDGTMYLDYLYLLEYFNKDLRNSFYVCPENLKERHDKLLKKKTDILVEQNFQRMIKKNKELEAKFKEEKEKFFDLKFTDSKISIEPLKSVKEFSLEGETLNHCLFTNTYFDRKDALILSAKIDGKRMETIEFSLSTLKVVQSRGYNNNPTKYNEQIIDLVNRNVNKIMERV